MAQLQRRQANRGAHALRIQRMDPLEDLRRILLQHARLDLIDVAHAVAGVDEFPIVLRLQGELEDAAGHMRAELLEQPVARSECLIGALLLGHVEVNGQVADPQAMVIQQHGGQHVHGQWAAVLAQQCPLAGFVQVVGAFHQHRLARRDALAQHHAQTAGARFQFRGQVQAFEGVRAHDLVGLEPQHLLGSGVKGVDHPAQVGGDDRNLGGGIQHAAQLTVGPAQLLLALAQLHGTLLHQFQRALALAHQYIEQAAEQQAEQAAHAQDRRQ